MAYSRYDLAGIKTVKFDSKDSYKIYGLILQKKEIDTPQRKITKVTSMLMDGDDDISDYISTPKYGNRKIKLSFAVAEDPSLYDQIYRKVCEEINGVYFDNSILIDGKTYSGRASVNKWQSSGSMRTIVVDIDAKPYCFDISNPTVKRYE